MQLMAGMEVSWKRWNLSWNVKMAKLLKGRESENALIAETTA